MWKWTLKSLSTQPTTLLASVAMTAAAFLLVMIFEAVYEGEAEQVVAYLEHSEADVWVMQRGVSNMHMATSYLSDWKVSAVSRASGVEDAEGILYLNTVVTTGGKPWFAFVVGLDSRDSRAGPWAMSSGRALPERGEAIVPAVFSRMAGTALGDEVRIADRDFTVAGLSEGTFSMANSVIFVQKRDLEDVMSSLDIASYILVWGKPGVEPAALAGTIKRRVEGVNALPAGQFIANDRRMAVQMGVETIALMTLIGAALAVMLVAFTMMSLVARQRRELAVLKALGVTNRSLYVSVTLQAVAITLASVGMAVVVAIALMPAATTLVPQLTLEFSWASAGRVAAIGIAIALLAALLPARQVARLDPLTVFRR